MEITYANGEGNVSRLVPVVRGDDKVRTSVVLTRAVHEAAKRKARLMGTSLSEVVRRALAEFASEPVPDVYLAGVEAGDRREPDGAERRVVWPE